MKQLAILLLSVIFPLSIIAQDVFITDLQVKKDYPANENNQQLRFELGVLTDMSKFTYNLDPTKSVFTEITDDTGYDLLSAQEKYEEVNKAKGYYYEELKMTYRSPISSGENPGLLFNSTLSVAPKSGATSVHIKGIIALINVAEGEETYTLKDIPGHLEWGAPGVQTDIGEVQVLQSGAYNVEGGLSFTKYQVKSDKPIISITVVGGDDREEAAKHFDMGLYGNELVFKKIPEKLDLVVVVKEIEIKEIPFDLNLTLGF